MSAMIRRRRRTAANSLDELASETSELVTRLLREHRVLRAENELLKREVERLSSGWDEVRRLARLAPRRRRDRKPATR
jgi:predicted RNase H-like nuclease (RuvC/YqgF family)